MHKIFGKMKEEFFAILPPTIFFFVALHLLTFIRVLMVEGSLFEPLSTTSIAVASLILGKAMLIADMLPPINRHPNKPLVYNIAWKAMIYLVGLYDQSPINPCTCRSLFLRDSTVRLVIR